MTCNDSAGLFSSPVRGRVAGLTIAADCTVETPCSCGGLDIQRHRHGHRRRSPRAGHHGQVVISTSSFRAKPSRSYPSGYATARSVLCIYTYTLYRYQQNAPDTLPAAMVVRCQQPRRMARRPADESPFVYPGRVGKVEYMTCNTTRISTVIAAAEIATGDIFAQARWPSTPSSRSRPRSTR